MIGVAKPANVDVILHDHDVLLWCGGIEIVPTPGHMPGHISLYLKESKTLISGDALAIQSGELGIANPEYTLDLEAAKQSIRQLLDYDIERIICYHGGVYDNKIKESLNRILLG
jgi:glyoxylase-like metal-dependent hydrolase (beta-lactamase superfamily II)